LARDIYITKAYYGLKTDIVKLLELQTLTNRNDGEISENLMIADVTLGVRFNLKVKRKQGEPLLLLPVHKTTK